MAIFGGRGAGGSHPREESAQVSEDPVERQYRYLLRTAPADALEAAHREALDGLSDDVRAAVLGTVQDALVAGQRLRPEDVPAIARLVTAGERRAPGVFLAACPAGPRRRLAEAVVAAEAAFGLFGGYAAWDGAEPEPVDIGVANDGDHRPDGSDPAAAVKSFAYGHSAAVNTWGTSGSA